MIVLDTNVASELMRPAPAPLVVAWVGERGAELVTTAITVARSVSALPGCPEVGGRIS